MSVSKRLVLQNMGGRTAHTVDQRTFKQLTKTRFGFYAQLSGAFGMQGDFITVRKSGGLEGSEGRRRPTATVLPTLSNRV